MIHSYSAYFGLHTAVAHVKRRARLIGMAVRRGLARVRHWWTEGRGYVQTMVVVSVFVGGWVHNAVMTHKGPKVEAIVMWTGAKACQSNGGLLSVTGPSFWRPGEGYVLECVNGAEFRAKYDVSAEVNAKAAAGLPLSSVIR